MKTAQQFLLLCVLTLLVMTPARGQPARMGQCSYSEALTRNLPATAYARGTLADRTVINDSVNDTLDIFLGNAVALQTADGTRQWFYYRWGALWPTAGVEIAMWGSRPVELEARYDPECRLIAELSEYHPPIRADPSALRPPAAPPERARSTPRAPLRR